MTPRRCAAASPAATCWAISSVRTVDSPAFAFDPRVERLAFQQLHGDEEHGLGGVVAPCVVTPEVEQSADVLMGDAARQQNLLLELLDRVH